MCPESLNPGSLAPWSFLPLPHYTVRLDDLGMVPSLPLPQPTQREDEDEDLYDDALSFNEKEIIMLYS